MSIENEISTPRQKAIFIIGFIFSVISILAVVFIPVSLTLNILLVNELIFFLVVGFLGGFALTGLVLNSIAFHIAKRNLSLIGLLLSIITLLFEGLYIMFYFLYFV
ncbi:MAG: hypothetical protein ACTSO7_12765 [Candidatus Heimdallarchaeota archaeon]